MSFEQNTNVAVLSGQEMKQSLSQLKEKLEFLRGSL
jgi:hypothetical protein